MSNFSTVTARKAMIPRLLLIISASLLALSLGGMSAAGGLPAQVQQEVSLVNYEQEGRFDYNLVLKPSFLFGPPPEPERPNAMYPAKIVSSIDFFFSFTPTTPGSASASADILLENPGLWAKPVELAREDRADGTSPLRFSLDIASIQSTFVRIEEEVKTATSPRQATVRVTVNTANQTLVQSLPMSLTDTIIRIDSGLVETGALGTGRFRYSVNLKPNAISEAPRVESVPPPSTGTATVQKSGQPVFGKLVDSMEATFDYRMTSDKPVSEASSEVRITALLEGTKLWSKEFELFNGTKGASFVIGFPIELADYLGLIDAIKNETGAPAEGYTLTLVASVHTVARAAGSRINDVFSQSFKATIKDNVLRWDDGLTKKDAGAVKLTKTVANGQTYLGMSVNSLMILTIVLAIVFSLFFGFSLIMFFRLRPTKSIVEREVDRIGKKYGPRMAVGRRRVAVELDSMQDLAKVADELGKPIVHETPDAEDEQHTYLVVDGFTVYRFRLPPDGIGVVADTKPTE